MFKCAWICQNIGPVFAGSTRPALPPPCIYVYATKSRKIQTDGEIKDRNNKEVNRFKTFFNSILHGCSWYLQIWLIVMTLYNCPVILFITTDE